MQNLQSRHVLGYALALLVFVPGCVGSKRVVTLTAPPGQKVTVEMKASNYAFDPGRIVARKGDTLVLQVTNVTKEKHDITVKDPSGKIVKSEDLPSGQTVTVEIPLTTAGVYSFYCAIDFHAGLGMKGKIEVQP
jgi:plastocyanin